jgi:hypothetical protein
MPTYFFNVIAGSVTIADEEGTDLPSLDAAKGEALKDARALMSQAILQGRDISGRRVDICDEKGAVLLSVPFQTAMTAFE